MNPRALISVVALVAINGSWQLCIAQNDRPATDQSMRHSGSRSEPDPGAERGLSPVENLNTSVFYATLQTAIDDASPGDNLRVYNNTLSEVDVLIDKTITIIGQGDGGTGTSIIDAGSVGRCMTIRDAQDVRIIGLTFRNGLVNDTDGGGVRIENSMVKFEGCIFLGNGVNNGLGGAMFAFSGSDVTVDGSNFTQNFATQVPVLFAPGGVSVVMTNCQFSDNGATDGPAEFMFLQNGSSLKMTNCTVARNGFSSEPGHFLIGAGGTEQVEIVSSILWGNEGTLFQAPNLFIFNSIFPGAAAFPSKFNQDVDPQFTDFDSFDFRLAAGSPAIDAGTSNALAEFDPVTEQVSSLLSADAFGRFRFVDDLGMPDVGFGLGLGFATGVPNLPLPDIGAHEFQGQTPDPCPADLLDDDVLDFGDVLQFLTYFGQGCPL